MPLHLFPHRTQFLKENKNSFSFSSDILRDVETRRQAVHSSAKILSDIVRHLTSGLHTIASQLESSLERVQRYEFARWTLMLGKVCLALPLTCYLLYGMVRVSYCYASSRMCPKF